MLPPKKNSGKFHSSIVPSILCNVKYSLLISLRTVDEGERQVSKRRAPSRANIRQMPATLPPDANFKRRLDFLLQSTESLCASNQELPAAIAEQGYTIEKLVAAVTVDAENIRALARIA